MTAANAVNSVGMAAAVVLAGVLVVAAMAKTRGRSETVADFDSLGLIGAHNLAVWVPRVEILTAVALVVTPGYGGPLAFALLAGFTIVLWRARQFGLQTGQTSSCACFGGTSSEPISSRHIARNVLLMGMALAATASDWTLLEVVG